jgi:sugar diacid utilization regulator
VFDAWAAEALAALSSAAGTEQHLAEPLHGRSGMRGAVLCGWRADASRARVDAGRRRLKLVANAAAGALARFVPADRTHAELRARVDELETVAKLAARLAGAGDERSVLGALLETASEAARFDGAFFAVRSGDGWEVRCVAGLGEAAVARSLRAAARLTGTGAVVGVESDVDAETVAVATLERTALLVGRRSTRDSRRDRVLSRLLADAAAALARIDAERGRTETIARLERERAGATARLERAARAVAARDAIAPAALEGLGPLAAALAGAIGGTAAVTDPDGRELARSGEAAGPSAWRPPRGGGPPRPVSQRRGGRRTVAAPALLGGKALAWVVSEDATEDAATVRAAVEHAAVLAASHRLRERTALEVELRIRGGFVDDVCARRAPDEQLLAQGRTLGLDLTAPSRVLLVEPSEDDALAGAALHDAVAECVRAWTAGAVAAARGRAVAVIFAEDGELAFEECLRRALDARVPGASFAIAVGTECVAVGDYARSDDAARRALELMRAVGDRDRTFSFRDESFETLLLQASDPAALLRFVERYVGPIDRADRGRSTELRRTLEAYFACGRNLEETARQLHVHVSTLRYRLSRACALAGVEPKDERSLRDLQLALAVGATLSRTSPSPGA